MKRIGGVGLIVLLLYGLLLASSENARAVGVQQDVLKRLGFYGVFTLGAGLIIIAGGIDLSIGSVIGLGAVTFGLLLEAGQPPTVALAMVLGGAGVIGLLHGLLVVYLRLQPFLVTLCGLFIYRGLAQLATRWPKGDSSRNVGLDTVTRGLTPHPESLEQFRAIKALANGVSLGVPNVFWLLLTLAAVVGVVLRFTVVGRYLYAIGHNETAARYAGVATARYRILAYAACATLAGLGGVLYLLIYDTADPSSAGNWFELYAITGAVIGGCSLRGGEGTAPGMVLGALVLPLLAKLTIFANIPSDLEYTVIGVALLVGTVIDELFRRRV